MKEYIENYQCAKFHDFILNAELRNKLQWNFDQYSNIFIQENVFENVVCEMASILSRPQCVTCTLIIMLIVHSVYAINSPDIANPNHY